MGDGLISSHKTECDVDDVTCHSFPQTMGSTSQKRGRIVSCQVSINGIHHDSMKFFLSFYR
ncbi:hypothetical protein EBZ35_07885 [bacterium]|nr:hypothetical protein [bacterium]